nr:Ycf33 [Erythrocladia irregularis]
MPTFWENTIRLVRFFLSSVTGLLFIIASPLLELKKKPIVFGIISSLSIITIYIIYQVLLEMLGINNPENYSF